MKIILEIFAALIFTNVFGVLYDYTYSLKSISFRKRYLTSISSVTMMIFFRNIIMLIQAFLMMFRKRGYFKFFIELIFFIAGMFSIIHVYINYHDQVFLGSNYYDTKFLGASCLILWVLIYSWIAATSRFFYWDKQDEQLSEKELKILNSEASFSDKISIFFKNFYLSFLTLPIYVIVILTMLYVYLINAIIG